MPKKIGAFLFVAFLLFCSPAGADTISYSILFNTTVDADDFLFSPTLGTLNSVQFGASAPWPGITASATYDGNATNQPITPGYFQDFNASGLNFVNVNSGRELAHVTIAGSGMLYVDRWSATGTIHNSNYSSLYAPLDDIDKFVLHLGDTSVIASSSLIDISPDSFTEQGNSYTLSSSSGSVIGSFNVTYNYTPFTTPVPEPATMLLLASGMAGLVGFRKRFRKG